MRRLVYCGIALTCLGVLLARPARTDAQPASASKTVTPFVLPDTAGKPWALADHRGKKAFVVLFLGTQCPINNGYAPRLAELSKQYGEKGVLFVAVNSNHHDS